MEPHMYNVNIESDLSVDKQNIIRQLSDMFCGKSLSKIRGICEECMWNVELCIDKLVTAEGDENGQPQSMNPTALKFSDAIQNVSGAVAKPIRNPSLQELPVDYASVYDNIIKGYKVLILLRGAPGSGKSYLAKSIVSKLMPGRDYRDFVLSADDYFIDALGRYKYNVENLGAAHDYCQTRAREKTALGWSPIIIDNTHIKMWEMMHYAKVAVQNSYIVEIMEPVTPWCKSVGGLASKNNHNVPKYKIQRMLSEFDLCTANDLVMMLKETKYKEPLPQLRTYPPPPEPPTEPESPVKVLTESTNINCEMETDPSQGFPEEASYAEDQGNPPAMADNGNNDAWTSYEIPSGEKQTLLPKSPRQFQRNEEESMPMQMGSVESFAPNTSNFDQGAAIFWGPPPMGQSQYKPIEMSSQLFPFVPTVWQTYEQEATNFWGVPLPTTSKSTKLEQMNTDQNESCGLLQLLKEGVKSINVPNKENTQPNEVNSEFIRHRVGCKNEDQFFVALRHIYPNKPIAELWDLFVTCGGSNDWAIDILLKDDESLSNDVLDSTENRDTYECGCDKPMTTKPSPEVTIPLTELNVKPQRAKPPRNRIPTAEILEIKEAVEKSFVLGDEHYSSHLNKIRNKRIAPEESNSPKAFVDVQIQTEGDDNDTISEEGGDVSEILEINIGEDLIGQLSKIFKSETTALSVPEKVKTNVFMPKSLARELYLLWMESVYNQMEEQRQSTLKEDEDFARLLKNPKYDNCKQPPENIKELLDMEFAWMVYKSEQEAYQATDTKHQQTNDLASHLTRMKLCELFPNIPQDTLLEVLAAHNNNFTETVEMLKSTVEPTAIGNQISASELIEKAKDEDEKLTKEVEKQQQEYSQTHSVPGGGQLETTPGTSRRRSLSPEEAKRLALKEFEESRNYAAHHCQLRAECYQKAKEAIQRSNGAVAVYYSNIANLHKKKIDIYNHRAANCIVEVHDRTQNNPDFIDLHYLHVIEAVNCLDIFVDRHIAKLRTIFRSYKYVFIITGRGLHSTGGVSAIKTRVKSRLKERNLKWIEVNPGLLKVKIFSASKFAKNL